MMHMALIRSEWASAPGMYGEDKEVLGFPTLFHWHCGRPMRRVVTYQRTDEGVSCVGCNSWVCLVCEKRRWRPVDYF